MTMPNAQNAKSPLLVLYAAIFALSGFSGLVYETVWTRYLKLFLGAAAFAQALTLALFMGGMAAGAWVAGKYGKRSVNPLFWYALVEGAVGIMGLGFHPLFLGVTGFTYQSIFPILGFSPIAVELAKWTLAAAMILPQAILLGATFPLMTAGVIRKHPEAPGETISIFYFVNSLGGAAGALAAGFYLLEALGLPGAIAAAGWINIGVMAVALIVSTADRKAKITLPAPKEDAAGSQAGWITPRVLLCAALTGMASFLYEIGWIRLLSLVLGASSHSFELMLSAFILGLALGGLIIRSRIEALENHLFALAEIQAAMGALALVTIYVYGGSFTAMATLLKALAKTPEGYLFFNLSSHAIAMAVMLPATIMAGMTLPLMTHFLFIKGEGEASIGKVYAANTLGGIAGVILGAQIIMPLFGLKSVIIAGAALDIAVGLWLFILSGKDKAEKSMAAVAAFGAAAILSTIFFARLDPIKMASGVFRFGRILGKETLVIYHKDGRTASVDVYLNQGSTPHQTISTNGKPDASIGFSDPTNDEITAILTAALPWDINPAISTVAVVGMGSGLTSHTALSIPQVKRVDTVEIEPAMVEGARLFGKRTEKVFTDPRSKIHINDAKAYFASSGKKYDLIISEPSNPWVAGVAGLFSTEFHGAARQALNEGGMFVQWMQLYEMEPELVASVMKAISANFEDYAVYLAWDTDMLVIARKNATLGPPTGETFAIPEMRQALERLGIGSIHDFAIRRLGGKKSLDHFFASYPMGMNSDYYPILEMGAIRARFMLSSASVLQQLKSFPLPVTEALDGSPAPAKILGENRNLTLARRTDRAGAILRAFESPGAETALGLDMIGSIRQVRSIEESCPSGAEISAWVMEMNKIAYMIQPFLPPEDLEKIWGRLAAAKCFPSLPEPAHTWVILHRALAKRDYPAAMAAADLLLPKRDGVATSDDLNYLTAAAMLPRILAGQTSAAGEIWNRYRQGRETPLPLRLLGAMTQSGGKLAGAGPGS